MSATKGESEDRVQRNTFKTSEEQLLQRKMLSLEAAHKNKAGFRMFSE